MYQAITFGEVQINAGGVYDYKHEALAHPIKIYQSVREFIYSCLFPMDTGHGNMGHGIKIKEYYWQDGKNFEEVNVVQSYELDYCRHLLLEEDLTEISGMTRGKLVNDLDKAFGLGLDMAEFHKLDQCHWDIVIILKYLKAHGVQLLKSEQIAIMTTFVNGCASAASDQPKEWQNTNRGGPPPNLDRIQWVSTLIHQGYYHFGMLFELFGLNKSKNGKKKMFRPASSFSGRLYRENCQSPKEIARRDIYEKIDRLMKN